MSKIENKVVIFCNGRSGSHLLGSFIDQHPLIYFDYEQFGAAMKMKYTTKLIYYFGSHLPRPFLKWRMSKAKEKGGYGISFHLDDYKHTSFRINDFHKQGFKIIRLNRDDSLTQMLSHQVAFSTKTWHRREGGEKPNEERAQITLDIQKCLYNIKYFIDVKEKLDKELAELPHLYLSYEGHLQKQEKHQATANKVFDFIGVNRIELRPSKFKPTYKKPYSELILNYKEFVDAAKAKGFLNQNHPY